MKQEVITVRSNLSIFFAIGILTVCSFVPVTIAEDGQNMTLEDAGLRLVTMRNDTSLDTNDDGSPDTFRVVIVLNATANTADVNMVLIASTGSRTIEQWVNTTVEGQENFSISLESWEVGQYSMTLQMYDPQTMNILVNLDLGSFWFEPALSLPTLRLSLDAPSYIQTGDTCMVTRVFSDEVGYRYGMMGSRTFTGAPFQVYESDEVIDCSNWPAGNYNLVESYQNGLGQSSEVELSFSINNRPAPDFSLEIVGNGDEIGTTCTVTIVAGSANESLSSHTKVWDVIPNQQIGDVTSIDCSDWVPGIHKVVVTTTNSEEISTTRGANIVRLPPILATDDNQSEENVNWPVRSAGSEITQNPNGWYAIGGISLVAFILVLLLTRRKDRVIDEDTLPSPEEMLLEETSQYVAPNLVEPDSGGLPIHTDEEGITWRRHDDGQVDWWDYQNLVWVRFE